MLHKAIYTLRRELRNRRAILLTGDVYMLNPEVLPDSTPQRFQDRVVDLRQHDFIPLQDFLKLLFGPPFDGQTEGMLGTLVVAANPFELLLKDPAAFVQSLESGRCWTLVLSDAHQIAPAIGSLYAASQSLDAIDENLRLILAPPVLGLPLVQVNWTDPRFGLSFAVNLSGDAGLGSKAWFLGEGRSGPDWRRELKPQPGLGILSIAEGVKFPEGLAGQVAAEFRRKPEVAQQACKLVTSA